MRGFPEVRTADTGKPLFKKPPMYTTLFILVASGTVLFYIASEKVKTGNKPTWAQGLAQKPILARALATSIFLICWIAAGYLQGPGSGTFAMVGYLMTSYCLVVLLVPLRYFNITRLAFVSVVALLVEIFIF